MLRVSRAPTQCHRGVSRREFAKRAGVGSAAAAGLVWAAPKISTIRYATKAAAGSVPPNTTTVTNTVPESALGGQGDRLGRVAVCRHRGARHRRRVRAGREVSRSRSTPPRTRSAWCTRTRAAPSTSWSPFRRPRRPARAHCASSGPTPGGTTQTLTTAITIKTAAECAESHVGAAGDPVGSGGAAGVPGAGTRGGSLPLTGSDAIDLAVIGGAAAIGGRVLYGATRHAPKPLDGSDG